ncbi:MAG: MBL fold metallo-hydrolase [Lachnospiraceae bacterium]|jgi:N-acyl homoserine lactone hydrolase
MIKVHVLACGSTRVDEALPFSDRSKNPLAFTGLFRGKKHQVRVPVRAYLIEYAERLVLIDIGWDTVIRYGARDYEGFFNYFASPGVLPAGEGIVDQLKSLGCRVSDLTNVYFTHLDIDHAGGMRLIRNVPEIQCSAAEWDAANKVNPRYLRRLWKDVPVTTFPDTEVDLSGNGTLTAFPMHGHSADMTAYRVGTKDHYVIIAGDAGYGRRSYEEQVLPGVEWNRDETRASLKKLKALADDPHCEAVLMTHDPEPGKNLYIL